MYVWKDEFEWLVIESKFIIFEETKTGALAINSQNAKKEVFFICHVEIKMNSYDRCEHILNTLILSSPTWNLFLLVFVLTIANESTKR